MADSSDEAYFCDVCYEVNEVRDAGHRCDVCGVELCDVHVEYHRRTEETRNHHVTSIPHTSTQSTGDSTVLGPALNENPVPENTKLKPVSKSGNKFLEIQKRYDVKSPAKHKNIPSLQKPGHNEGKARGKAQRIVKKQCNKKITSASGYLFEEFNANRKSEITGCQITGIVILDDKVLVCDKINSKLKVFDMEHNFIYQQGVPIRPFDIDRLDSSMIAVSSGTGRCVKLMSVGQDSMAELVHIDTGKTVCAGICCYRREIYCVVRDTRETTGTYSEIHKYTPDGYLAQIFYQINFGEVECRNLWCITVNPESGILYVTDVNEGVVAITTDGYVVTVVSLPTQSVSRPRGICVNDNGEIFVCGIRSHTVVRLSPDGSDVTEVLTASDGCRRPQCLGFHGNKLFVCCSMRNTVLVYDLGSNSKKDSK